MDLETQAQIADLLARARQQHLNYRHALPGGPNPNEALSVEAMRNAYELRRQAESLDPNLSSPPFRTEPENYHHDAVMQFYREKLGL